jgi:aryl-alcohol dehydrogenase-like predicted oxidoreductase
MEYRKLGKSDLNPSCLALGTWAFGGGSWWGRQKNQDSVETLYRALELGINFIDTAPVYGRGLSEEIIGKALKRKNLREKVIIATKVGLVWKGRNIFSDLSRKSILKEFEDSLRRLKIEWIDLYQVHWPDPLTPIQETAETMCDLYQKGKIKAIGVSNFSVEQMEEFMKYSPLHCLQPPYNMFKREIEAEILPFCQEQAMGVIVYSPLHSGILTGKFFFGEKIPSDKARSTNPDLKKEYFQINKEFMIKLKEIASAYGKTLSQLALNWVISKPGITSAIVGARKASQIEENVGAVDWKLSKEDLEKIERLLEERERMIKTSIKV